MPRPHRRAEFHAALKHPKQSPVRLPTIGAWHTAHVIVSGSASVVMPWPSLPEHSRNCIGAAVARGRPGERAC